MTALVVVQHVPFEGPGAVADWASERGVPMAVRRPDLGDPLADARDAGLLVVLGGPMSANDSGRLPWLEEEIGLLRARIDADRPTLGVCLGAQLIARAAGSAVGPGAKEIGWFPVRRSPGSGAGGALPEAFTPLHWHGETFDLPDGAVRLAETDACPNQAFRLGENVAGYQFHAEATEASVRELVAHASGDISGGPFEQDASAIVDCAARVAALRPVLDATLDGLLAGATH